jgi:hypothetical protein
MCTSSTANLFWPGENAQFTFELVNNTNDAISMQATMLCLKLQPKYCCAQLQVEYIISFNGFRMCCQNLAFKHSQIWEPGKSIHNPSEHYTLDKIGNTRTSNNKFIQPETKQK